MNIGSRLRKVREDRKMSGRALALQVGVVPSQISKIESGATNPSIDLLQKLCEALGITMAEFFAEDGPELAPEFRRLLESAQKLTPEQRESLQRLIDSMNKE